MTDQQGYEEDKRTPAELIAEWDSRPPREKAGPLSYAKSTAARGALFAKLHCPDSIRKPKGRQS